MTETCFYAISDISSWILAHKPVCEHDIGWTFIRRKISELLNVKRYI
jgi:hypothetical protein